MKTVGKVGRVNIFEDRNGRSKGCGVVEFDSKEDALKAIKELNETMLEGRPIYLREDNPDLAKKDYEHSRSKKYTRERRSGSRDRRRGNSRSHSRSYSPRRDSYDKSRRHERRDHHNRSRSRDDRGGYKIYIRNIPWSVTWQQLKDAFSEYGHIIRADVPQDRQGRSAGYGIVRFEREKDALKAKDNMDGASFNGRKITVELSS